MSCCLGAIQERLRAVQERLAEKGNQREAAETERLVKRLERVAASEDSYPASQRRTKAPHRVQ